MVSEIYFNVRYVDDTFATFSSQNKIKIYLRHLNNLQPTLKFKMEVENKNTLPFLGVLLAKSYISFVTSLYRNPTFTGLYLRWDSFSPKSRKINPIKTLNHRALMICSESKLNAGLKKITGIFLTNDNPESVILSKIRNFKV